MSETSNSKPINGRGLKKLWALIDRHKQDKLKKGDIGIELLSDGSVTASKIADGAVGYEAIDWATMGQPGANGVPMAAIRNDVPRADGFGSGLHNSKEVIIINNAEHKDDNTTILSLWRSNDGVDSNGSIIFVELGVITFSDDRTLLGKSVRRYRHGNYSSGHYGKDWETV